MERKSITTTRAAVACDVCGRTLLRGEHADPFIAGGARRMVCELCIARAANEGWIREGADNALGVRRNGPRGGRSLLGAAAPAPGAGRRAPADEPVAGRAAARNGNVDRIERAPAPRTTTRRRRRARGARAARRAAEAAATRRRVARAAPRARRADERRPQDGPRAGRLQRERAPAPDRRRRALARPAGRDGPAVGDRGLDRLDRRRLGAVLVSLRGRPRRRGRRRARQRPGRRADRAHGRRARGQRRRRRARHAGAWPDERCGRVSAKVAR